MGTKRIGLARVEALVENLKREIAFGEGTVLKGNRCEVIALTNASTTSRALLATESGALITIDASTNTATTVTVTMPAIADAPAGVWYELAIIADQVHDDADIIITTASASGANFIGSLTQGGAANHTGASQTVLEVAHGTITFDATVSTTFGNSYVKVVSNGTNWIITGQLTSVSGVSNPVASN